MPDYVDYEAAKLWAQRKLEQDALEAKGERNVLDKALDMPMDAWRAIALSVDANNTDRGNSYGGSDNYVSPAEAARSIYAQMKTSDEARHAMKRMATSGRVDMPLGHRLYNK